MRLLATLALLLAALPALGFEIEEETRFPASPATAELRVLSTTDTVIFEPLIRAFQATRPGLAIRYTVASSQDLFGALYDEAAAFDLAISSAMDLQMKLANDGLAQSHRSPATEALPAWAHWRDQLYAFAQEPVVLVISARAFQGLPVPRTRADLVRLLRDHPARFEGRIGTYDPALSGAGYLFATQDARQSDTFWRLAEVMGGLSPRLYAATGDMLADLEAGRLALAYNVLGSYATARLAPDGDARIVEFEDFTLTLLRTALIPRTAPHPELGAAFLDFLLSPRGQRLIENEARLPPIDEAALAAGQHLRPIRLDPGLLVYVDPIKRRRFLEEWRAALVQP
jgi:iron(III) transport system substrate-binding protein